MKSLKLTLLFAAIACIFLSCKKGDSPGLESDCEDNSTTKVTFTNTGSTPLRVQVANSLTPQFVPINPIVSIDLAPGEKVTREFPADRYFSVWSRDCTTNCSMVTYYSKTYTQCNSYEEKQGI